MLNWQSHNEHASMRDAIWSSYNASLMDQRNLFDFESLCQINRNKRPKTTSRMYLTAN